MMSKILSQSELLQLWTDFGNTPINEDETIAEPFHVWDEGVDRVEIWHWFDSNFQHGIHLHM